MSGFGHKVWKGICRTFGISKEEALWWAIGEFLIYWNSPRGTFIFNSTQLGAVGLTALYNSFFPSSKDRAPTRLGRLLNETLKPNLVNASFWLVNATTAAAETAGIVTTQNTPSELRMKTLYAGVNLGFYGTIALQDNPRFKEWISKQSRFLQALAKPELFIGPSIAVFYDYPLTPLKEKLGTVGSLPVLPTILWTVAGVVMANAFREAYKPARSFMARNLGLVCCQALNVFTLTQTSDVSLRYWMVTAAYTAGTGIYLAKDFTKNRRERRMEVPLVSGAR